MVDDIHAKLGEAIDICLARAEISAFDGVVEKAVHAVAVILVVLGGVYSTLGCDAVRPARRILKAEALHVVAQLTHCRGGCASGQSRAHNDDGVFALVCWVYQLHLEAMAIPFLCQWPAGNARVELNTHRTIPANTATGTAVNAAHTRIAMTSETLRCSGWGDGGLSPMLLTELHAP